MDWVTKQVWSGWMWAGLFWVCLLTVLCSALLVIAQGTCYFGSSAEKRWQHHGQLKLLTFPQALPVHPRIYTPVLLQSLLLHMHWLHVDRYCDACAPAKHSDGSVIRKTKIQQSYGSMWRLDTCADQAECKTLGQVSGAWGVESDKWEPNGTADNLTG